jgi:hypothetical protein
LQEFGVHREQLGDEMSRQNMECFKEVERDALSCSAVAYLPVFSGDREINTVGSDSR